MRGRTWFGSGLLTLLLSASAVAQHAPIGTGIGESSPIAGSHLLQERSAEFARFAATHPEMQQTNALRKSAGGWGFVEGSAKTWWGDNLADGSQFQVSTTCKKVGTHCYVFVEDSSWAKGSITQAIVDTVRNAFDLRTPADPGRGVYDVDVSTFGTPKDVDGDSLIIIVIMDIRDSWTAPGQPFVVGYYYSLHEYNDAYVFAHYGLHSNQAEIYFLDCHPLDLTNASQLLLAESTTAHEFQHMIHFNYDMYETTFVNEGCSVTAEVINGFSIYPQSYYTNETNHRLFDWRSNSDIHVLNDYSRAARFFVYLRDQVGTGYFRKLVSSTKTGIAGIDTALYAYGSSLRFATALPNWFVANALNDTMVSKAYGYTYPGLPNGTATALSAIASSVSDTIQTSAVRYFTVQSSSNRMPTFTWSDAHLVVKAVETGPGGKKVASVSSGVKFQDAAFGTTYTQITFAVMNVDTATWHLYTYSVGTATGVTTEASQSQVFGLEQNYPNPFNPTTVLRYTVPVVALSLSKGGSGQSSVVSLKVYDLLGREVATLVNGEVSPGEHTITWNAANVPSGVYFYRLAAGTFSETKKLVLTK